MELDLIQVDSFTDRLFSGNPAAVCPLNQMLPDDIIGGIAMENNLSETAFFVETGPARYHLRWFTPTVEVALCGHATLAAAYVIFTDLAPQLDTIIFDTLSGPLPIKKKGNWLE